MTIHKWAWGILKKTKPYTRYCVLLNANTIHLWEEQNKLNVSIHLFDKHSMKPIDEDPAPLH